MAKLDAGQLVKLAKKYPVVMVAGVGGVGLAAFMATRSSTPPILDNADASATDPNTDPFAMDPGAGDPAAGSPFAGPPGYGYGYDPFGASGPDPFGPGTDPTPATTADGCTWPPPTIPAGYEGRGSWSCDAASATWVWNWITAPPPPGGGGGGDTSPGGCPLPKPTVPTRLIGQYKYVCHNKQWKLAPVGTTTPPPDPKPKPGGNVSKGRHETFAGHVNARNKLVLSDHRQLTLAAAAHFELGPRVQGDRTPGKPHGNVTVRKIKAAPHHAGLVGRYLKVG